MSDGMTDNRSQPDDGAFEGVQQRVEVKPGLLAAVPQYPVMRFQHTPTLGKLAAALAKAQGEFGTVLKEHEAKVKSERTGTTYTYKYADLADVLAAVRPALSKNGVAIVQIPTIGVKTGMILVTRLIHGDSGEWLEGEYPMSFMPKPQEMGALLTYARRYSLSAMLGVASEEDTDADVQDTGQEQQAPRTAAPRTQTSAPPAKPPAKDNKLVQRRPDPKPEPGTTVHQGHEQPEPPPPEAPPPAPEPEPGDVEFDPPINDEDLDPTIHDPASSRRASQTLSGNMDSCTTQAELRELRKRSQRTLRSIKAVSETAYKALAEKFDKLNAKLPE